MVVVTPERTPRQLTPGCRLRSPSLPSPNPCWVTPFAQKKRRKRCALRGGFGNPKRYMKLWPKPGGPSWAAKLLPTVISKRGRDVKNDSTNTIADGLPRYCAALSPEYDVSVRFIVGILLSGILVFMPMSASWGADKEKVVNLTNNQIEDTSPSWSPDGTRIAFASRRDSYSDIYTMDNNGANVTRLTQGIGIGENFFPSWSPDGMRIAFTSGANNAQEIYVINVDGTNPINLTNSPGTDCCSAWSPDGKKIAFASVRDGNYEIFLMDADGTNLIRLTSHLSPDGWPTWSPDGEKIAFMSRRSGGDEVKSDEIYVMNADGTNIVRLTNNLASDTYPAWSPDGTRIAFASTRDDSTHESHGPGSFSYEVYVMNVDGTNTVRLTESLGDDFFPSWSPNGKSITFASRRESPSSGSTDIYVTEVDWIPSVIEFTSWGIVKHLFH